MSWKLIKAIQKAEGDLRLILAFGLNLRVGDIITVNADDGSFTLEGNSTSLLGVPAGKPRASTPAAVALTLQGGKDTQCQFRADGTGSTLFPELPKASAGFDVSFGSSEGWLLAFTGRDLHALPDVDKFRAPMLAAYSRGVWKEDWVLITSVSTVEGMTLLAARSADTKIALKVSGHVVTTTALEAKLTSGATIMATNKQITRCIISERMPAFCQGIRVRDRWWRKPDTGSLDGVRQAAPSTPTAEEFWEDMDEDLQDGKT
jgi:hypothetical protein